MTKTGPSIDAIIEEFQMKLEEQDFSKAIDIDLSRSEYGGVSLDRIHSHQRGQGFAGHALELLLSICDKYNVEIWVIPHPLDEETREDLLQAWYKRYGFVWDNGHKHLLRRKAQLA